METPISNEDDPRTVSTAKFDTLVDQINVLTAAIERRIQQDQESKVGQTQDIRLIHKSEGLSGWSIAAVLACFVTWFGFLGLMILGMHFLDKIENHFRDVDAWVQLHGNEIAKLKAHQEEQKK